MKKVARMVFVASLLMVFSGVAQAGVGGVAKLGLLGVGGELTLGVSQKTNLRLGVNRLNLGFDFSSNDDENDVSNSEEVSLGFDLHSISGLLDWHPEGGGFRLSAGLILNNNEINVTADLSKSISINDVDYSLDSLQGNGSFRSLAPYIGLGWGNAVDKNGRWTFAFDLGLMFQGDPDISITATASDPRVQAMLNEDLEKQSTQWEDDYGKYVSIWPVMSFGIGFRFF